MTDPMTAERITEIRERAEKATSGPWEVLNPRGEGNDYGLSRCDGIWGPGETAIVITDGGYYPPTVPDAEFIVHARQDIPDLLDALSAAQQEIAALRAERDDLQIGVTLASDRLTKALAQLAALAPRTPGEP